MSLPMKMKLDLLSFLCAAAIKEMDKGITRAMFCFFHVGVILLQILELLNDGD
jgi:hypothetical protein